MSGSSISAHAISCKANAMSVSFNTQNKSLHVGHNTNSMQQMQQSYHKNTQKQGWWNPFLKLAKVVINPL